jgi:hypothetical protein
MRVSLDTRLAKAWVHQVNSAIILRFYLNSDRIKKALIKCIPFASAACEVNIFGRPNGRLGDPRKGKS